jgi:DNA repair protein RecO (recombination protein O)
MPSVQAESLVLRSYAYGEANLIVVFFTREQGKLRGVAKGARKPKSRFGSGLERLTHARLTFNQQENRELYFLTASEVIQSPFLLSGNFEVGVALDLVAEVSDLLLPPQEANERHFRLILAILDDLRAGGSVWRASLYFILWAVKLSGVLGDPVVSTESAEIAREMLTTPLARLTARDWTRATGRDLRRWLIRDIETHAERRLQSAPILENIDS